MLCAFAQKVRITGKVTNTRNEALAGVTIRISGATKGMATSNAEGYYSIAVDAGKQYQVVFSYVGYVEKAVEDVTVSKASGEEVLNIVLEENKKNSSEVTVKSSARSNAKGETVNALIAFQKNTNTVASVISAEAIRRSPDKNTGEVLKRTPGASIQDGRFLVVRGLPDRYNLAMLNGIPLNSTEPDRKAFSFDLIPANMIDNIVINKAFVPELPGEWAGGLVQVNTRDIPTKSFFNVQAGVGFNTQTISNDFYKYKGGKLDWLGLDDGYRALPDAYTTKSQFDALSNQDKINIAKQMPNVWSPYKSSSPINGQFQMAGGFNANLKGQQQLGGIIGITYNASNRYIKTTNDFNDFQNSGVYTPRFRFSDDKYAQDVSWGGLGSLTYQINARNKVSIKSLVNVNTTDYSTVRTGIESYGNATMDSVHAYELAFKQNIFWNSQLIGEHTLNKEWKLKWYGSFGLLDNYVPDQRRIYYTKNNDINSPYSLLLANSLSQKSGNRYYQNLSDYIYTAGGDLSYNYTLFGFRQTLKGGYMFQVKDRLFDAKPFSVYLPTDNAALRLEGPETVFSPDNYGDGSNTSNKLAFNAIKGSQYRYMANTILNAGFVQFDNQFTNALRVVWGVRVENYDQVVGSMKTSDPKHTHSEVRDYLPGLNATYKINSKTNIRLSGSQTVVRPEFRELATFQYYDFDLNAAVQGNPALERTKITNADLRYELYPGAGEVFTLGVFYKYFDKPIEAICNPGDGGSTTYNIQNAKKATDYGVELELRKRLDFTPTLKNFTFQANLAYIKSKVTDENLQLDRPLQGQSPYVINLGLMYDLEKQGLSATLLFNQIGKRIAFVGNVDPNNGVVQPDVYEAARPVMDFQVTKKLLKNKADLRLNVQDILNQKQYFYQNASGSTGFDKNSDPYRFTRQYGTTFSVVFGYTL